MKKIILSALTLLALSSCASDKGDVDENKGAVKKGGGAVTASCVQLNGKYEMKVGEATKSFSMFTKVEDGKTSYTDRKDGDYVVADGQRQEIKIGDKSIFFSLTCDATTLTAVKYNANDATDTTKYTLLEDGQVKLEATGEEAALNGTYALVKEEEVVTPAPTPAPAPAPVPQPTPVMGCPVFNGKYVMKTNKDGNEHTQSFEMATKEEDGKTSYAPAPGAEFVLADGQPHQVTIEGVKATVTLSCEPSVLNAVVSAEGKEAISMKYTALENNQIQVEATGEAASQNGIYTKE